MRQIISPCRNGFTLIESLVVVGVFSILALISSQILLSTLKGTTKSETESEVHQNGDYALSVISQMLRNSRRLISPTTSGSYTSLTIQNPDRNQTVFTCDLPNQTVASNSARLISDNIKATTCSFEFTFPPSGPPTVTIDFTLVKNPTSSRPEETAQTDFTTQVTLRNY